MGNWTLVKGFAAVACSGALMGLPATSALADNHSGGDGAYWTNPDGEVWVNADGECWYTPNAPKEEPREECGDKVAQAEPEPKDSDGDGVIDANDECPGTPAGTEVDSVGCPVEKDAPIVLKGVKFEFNSAKLTAGAESRLDNVVNALTSADGIDVRIEGHTDSIGSNEYNLELSQDRADSVKAYLVDNGIAASRMVTRGFGETRPVAPNTQPDGSDNPAGRAENRRVELHVIDE
ncbi:OmpA family protein [Salinisphaera sp. P385]|uniref:OmpA family protein n=1 Tax=Spectribacter acetivorans TaxID=3075603 RepID=A0ABU3BAJ3_9GAMM|nr:OmpA family protein [Salinisphaera sp. P385]MDT0619070.1 OmpA family protein [Salinisphaera sp. P385]